MGETLEAKVREICRKCGGSKHRMMDIVREVQAAYGCVSREAMALIAREVQTHRVEVESVVSFYAFLSEKQKGRTVIRLCNDVVDRMFGADRVAAAFEEELGIKVGETTPDGAVTLEYTPCIGMCDQAPAALIDDKIVTSLSPDSARGLAKAIKSGKPLEKLGMPLGDGNNAHPLVQSMVKNNIRKRGGVIFDAFTPGDALKKTLAMSPAEVIGAIKASRLRGRGGAGFPAGMKWEFTRAAPGTDKYILCNADEGEPGTFKDRVLLTELADLVFEGMTVGGYAIGAKEGILYLRGEYEYLRAYLEEVLAQRRKAGLLGKGILGKGVDFDIRIQMGAGAYICGEESGLISSCEGLRGDPKDRPPFPAQKGYLASPTSVNNVETLCAAARIMERGAAWFAGLGSKGSSGTKLLSISGDCREPGVYELPFGTSVADMLKEAGGEGAAAVLIGGPSGQIIGPDEFKRTICYDDLATGGAVVVFGKQRDLLEIVQHYMEFFEEETCGYCTPCRVGNTLLLERLERIRDGKGQPGDLAYLKKLGDSMKVTSRCGLGQTSANPVLSTLKNFRPLYEALVKERTDGMQPAFELERAVAVSEGIVGRKSTHGHA
jgi:[NiFe] hydrogenase diaphorase moiety large subunit